MKTYCLTAGFVCIASLAMAQNNGNSFYKKLGPSFKALGINEQSGTSLTMAPGIPKTYTLPVDNMPCLVSPSQSLMPVYKTPLVKDGIPNALPLQNLFAQEDAIKADDNTGTVSPNLNLMLELLRKNKTGK